MAKKTKQVDMSRREKMLRGLQIIGTLGLITLLPSFNKVAEVIEQKKKIAKTEADVQTNPAVWG